MKSHTLHQRTLMTYGFTLIELIGVLAVISMLAASIAPNIIKQAIQSKVTAEHNALDEIALHLKQYILTEKHIPSALLDEWASAVSSYSDNPISTISTNKNHHQRKYYLDPQFLDQSNVTNSYTQKLGLKKKPFSPRIMIISNLENSLSEQPLNHQQFDDLWTRSDNAILTENASLMIKRINLRAYFHRVLLNNKGTGHFIYQVEDSKATSKHLNQNNIGQPLDYYILENSKLTLINNDGSIDSTHIIKSDTSFNFQNNRWYSSRGTL